MNPICETVVEVGMLGWSFSCCFQGLLVCFVLDNALASFIWNELSRGFCAAGWLKRAICSTSPRMGSNLKGFPRHAWDRSHKIGMSRSDLCPSCYECPASFASRILHFLVQHEAMQHWPAGEEVQNGSRKLPGSGKPSGLPSFSPFEPKK